MDKKVKKMGILAVAMVLTNVVNAWEADRVVRINGDVAKVLVFNNWSDDIECKGSLFGHTKSGRSVAKTFDSMIVKADQVITEEIISDGIDFKDANAIVFCNWADPDLR